MCQSVCNTFLNACGGSADVCSIIYAKTVNEALLRILGWIRTADFYRFELRYIIIKMEECCPQEGEFVKKTTGLCAPDQSLGKVERLRVPRRDRDLERTAEGCLIMNERNLKLLCESDGLY